MRKTLASIAWALLILAAAGAAGAVAVLSSDRFADTVAAASNDLLGWWAETALAVTRELRS